MGYTKKKFEGKYLNWYNTIAANKGIEPEIIEYSPVFSEINSLDWEGESKDSIYGIVKDIDKSCQDLYNNIKKNIDKVKKCTGPLYNSLQQLKDKCDEYNLLVDEYDRALEELRKNKEVK